MKKDVTICFRTSENLRKSLDKASREGKKSLSGTIENVLLDYLKQRGTPASDKERRRHSRKEVSLPAFISTEGSKNPYPGIIVDISLGGLRLSLPKESRIDVQEEGQTVYLNILFTLPKEKSAVAMTCKSNRMKHINGDIEVGATFADCDFTNYQKLQNYLLQ